MVKQRNEGIQSSIFAKCYVKSYLRDWFTSFWAFRRIIRRFGKNYQSNLEGSTAITHYVNNNSIKNYVTRETFVFLFWKIS